MLSQTTSRPYLARRRLTSTSHKPTEPLHAIASAQIPCDPFVTCTYVRTAITTLRLSLTHHGTP